MSGQPKWRPPAEVREGAEEVKAKLREDLSRWARLRRFVSLKPEIPCLECDGAGKIQCAACRGTGKSAIVTETGEQEPCPHCGGHGSITCVDCAGRGVIPNRNRKPLIWILVAGGVAWALILFQLWGGDILPEQRAAVLQRGEHGRSVVAPPQRAGGGVGVAIPRTQGGGSTNPVAPAGGVTYRPVPPAGSGAGGGAQGAQPWQQGYVPGDNASGTLHGNSVPSSSGFAQPPGPYGGVPRAGYGATGAVPGSGMGGPMGGGNSLPTRPGSYGR